MLFPSGLKDTEETGEEWPNCKKSLTGCSAVAVVCKRKRERRGKQESLAVKIPKTPKVSKDK